MTSNNILTIAGSDLLSGGGMQADLATFAHFGLYGMVALTSIVPVIGDKFVVNAVNGELFQQELASFEGVSFSAIKLGLLPNREILDLTAAFLQKQTAPVILDPVIVFKENQDYSVNEMRERFIQKLIPKASVITPNLREAEILADRTIKNLDDMKAVAKILYDFGTKAVVIKGGNRFDDEQAIDLTYDGKDFQVLKSPLLTSNNNGAGCTFASTIASQIALGKSFKEAVETAKAFVFEAISNANAYGVFQNKKVKCD